MAKVFEVIDDHLRDWIARQPVFFVGTAPLAGDGHVNVSPKGPIGTFRVLGPRRVAYLDVVGSGAETIAHLRENGRIVVMLCAFEGPPRIVRLHGRGTVVALDDPAVAEAGFAATTPDAAHRAVIVVDVTRIADSCGYGVPLMAYEGERPHQALWADKKLRTGGPDALERYKADKNACSIDGLPAL
ncbi:MAG TPA: pyridoxamine 5'-phosphate oxidase family protein [Solirubrobacteraceae bacterium]|jgi:predicted pyridoxine 5'-phosphate oxidase superfamily flavin-nucleotide-binding protein